MFTKPCPPPPPPPSCLEPSPLSGPETPYPIRNPTQLLLRPLVLLPLTSSHASATAAGARHRGRARLSPPPFAPRRRPASAAAARRARARRAAQGVVHARVPRGHGQCVRAPEERRRERLRGRQRACAGEFLFCCVVWRKNASMGPRAPRRRLVWSLVPQPSQTGARGGLDEGIVANCSPAARPPCECAPRAAFTPFAPRSRAWRRRSRPASTADDAVPRLPLANPTQQESLKQRDNISKEMKDRLRKEYIGFGGTPNKVSD
jgi:hypothetical protein